jgi:hypothetical protein
MSYTSTIDGVQVSSNVPLDQSQPSGTFYSCDIVLSNSIIAYIVAHGLDIAAYIDPNLVASQFSQSGHPVQNLTITQPSSSVVNVSFSSTSPQIAEVAAIIFGIFLIVFSFAGPLGWLADALGILLVTLGGIGLVISSLAVTVSQLAGKIGAIPATLFVAGGLALAGILMITLFGGSSQTQVIIEQQK